MAHARFWLYLVVVLFVAMTLAGCADRRAADDDGDGSDAGAGPDGGANGPGGPPPEEFFEPDEPGADPEVPDEPLPPSGTRIPGVAIHDGTGALLQATDVTLRSLGFEGRPTFAQTMTGQRGAEPSIGFRDTGELFYIASTRALRSTDGGFSFEVVKTDPTTADPLLWVDRDTGRVFVNQLWIGCSFMHWSDDGGATWTTNPVACGLPINDHQKMTTAPRTGGSAVPSTAYPNVVYYCASQAVQSVCAVSYDGGVSWVGNRAVPSGECGGLHGMPWGAADGTVYLPYHGCDRPVSAVTETEGVTWTQRPGPTVAGVTPRGLDPDVATTSDGTVYMVYAGKNHLPYMIRSDDKGNDWDGPFRISPPHVSSTAFAAMAAGDDGRVAFAYIGSENYVGDPNDAPDETIWNLYVTFSLNADSNATGLRFVTVTANPAGDPIQRGRICLEGFVASDACAEARNLLDFIDATIDFEGRFYVSSADGCTSQACIDGSGGAGSSRSEEGALWFVQAGPSLMAATDGLVPLAAPIDA